MLQKDVGRRRVVVKRFCRLRSKMSVYGVSGCHSYVPIDAMKEHRMIGVGALLIMPEASWKLQ